jgi:hypothetical protein
MEWGDLDRLVIPEMHIDEFKSRMGDDADVIVLSFKLKDKEPANDLMMFIERGYEWVLDADMSSGDFNEGEFFVFIELERSPEAAEQIQKLLLDLVNLTKQKPTDWQFIYGKKGELQDVTIENLENTIPLTPDAYTAKFGEEEDDKEIEAMQEAARVPMDRKAPKNSWTESLRIAAGLK